MIIEPLSIFTIDLYFEPIIIFENHYEFLKVNPTSDNLSKPHKSVPKQTYFQPNLYKVSILCQYSVLYLLLNYIGQIFTLTIYVDDISDPTMLEGFLHRNFMLAILLSHICLILINW